MVPEVRRAPDPFSLPPIAWPDELPLPLVAMASPVSVTWPGSGYGNKAFTGREWDPEIQAYYYRARYYDPKLGRFISEDPIGFRAGVNFYAYVNNGPLVSRDPSGRNPGVLALGGSALAGLTLPAWVGPALIATGIAFAAVGAYQLLVKPHLTDDASDKDADRNWKQDKKLSPGEIKKLKENDINPEQIKGGRKTGELDLYKTPKGDIVIKPKGGDGPGEPTGININSLPGVIPDPCP